MLLKILLCFLLGNSSVFSNSQSAMSLIIINLISFFRAVANLPKGLRFQCHINARWVTQNNFFCSSFAIWKQIFIKDRKLVGQENIQIMKTCCIIVMSIAKLIIMYVLQKYLKTISSFLSSDGHLKPVCVCKLAHNYEHCYHSPLGCRFVLSNVWYESYLQAFDEYILWKPQKLVQNIISFRGCDLELKMELLKLLAIQSKIFEVNLLMMKGRIWEKRLEDIIFALNFKYI